AILYHVLTGRPPFQRDTPLETLNDVVHEEPVPPTALRDGLPQDIETICLTCLRKDPARRYASALELAEDLQRFLAGAAIRARPAGAGEPLLAALLLASAGYGARLRGALGEVRRQHARAERNAQRLAFLLDATQQLMTTTKADDLLRLLSETSTRLLDAERATIFLMDEERKELWSKVAMGDGVGEIRVP